MRLIFFFGATRFPALVYCGSIAARTSGSNGGLLLLGFGSWHNVLRAVFYPPAVFLHLGRRVVSVRGRLVAALALLDHGCGDFIVVIFLLFDFVNALVLLLALLLWGCNNCVCCLLYTSPSPRD